jgi:8-oxo-dGTP pyrophosphatase MutT (NUDIX family)
MKPDEKTALKPLPVTANPWQPQRSETVFENPWLTLSRDDVINPGGGISHYGKINFKNLAIGIIPIDEHNNTWLVGQYRYVPDCYSWEIPMGGGPLAIDPLESAKRELREETGLTARHWQELMQAHTSNSVTDERGIVYLATGLTEGETEFEETEDLLVVKLPVEEAIERVLCGEITDLLSVAGLLKLAAQRNNRA